MIFLAASLMTGGWLCGTSLSCGSFGSRRGWVWQYLAVKWLPKLDASQDLMPKSLYSKHFPPQAALALTLPLSSLDLLARDPTGHAIGSAAAHRAHCGPLTEPGCHGFHAFHHEQSTPHRCGAAGRDRGVCVCRHQEDPPPIGQRAVCTLALGSGVPHPDRLLWIALAGVGAASGRAVRPGGPALLPVRHRAVPAGFHLPDRAAGDLGLVSVPVHGGGRAPVVRLRLPADGVHRDLSVDRAAL